MTSGFNSRANVAYFYKDIILIFMNVKFCKVQIEQRKMNYIHNYLQMGGGSAVKKYIEIFNNQSRNPLVIIYLCCAFYISRYFWFFTCYYMLAPESMSAISIVGGKDILAPDITSLTESHVYLFVE